MTDSREKSTSTVASWFSNGPWRSRTVMIALLVTLVGLFFWMGDAKDGTRSDGNAPETTNRPAVTQTNPLPNSTDSDWDWNTPLPGYAKFSASYIVGCCVGWFFRRVTRLILVVGGIAVALLAVGHFVGLETGRAQDEVKKSSEWTKRTMETAKDSLAFAVPSAAGFGVGMFMGFRRRCIQGTHGEVT